MHWCGENVFQLCIIKKGAADKCQKGKTFLLKRQLVRDCRYLSARFDVSLQQYCVSYTEKEETFSACSVPSAQAGNITLTSWNTLLLLQINYLTCSCFLGKTIKSEFLAWDCRKSLISRQEASTVPGHSALPSVTRFDIKNPTVFKHRMELKH